MKTALVLGATGLVGTHLVQLLLADPRVHKVVVFVRRASGIIDAKLEEHIIDFDSPSTWRHLVKGDILFSCLGTTLKQAGSQKAQFTVDYTYQYNFAVEAASNTVPVYVLVSSASADPQSKLFYTRIKGELERDVKKLPFSRTAIIQPGLLAGRTRNERFGEKVAAGILNGVNALGLFRKYRPIPGITVARAMINAALSAETGIHVYTLEDVFALGRSEL